MKLRVMLFTGVMLLALLSPIGVVRDRQLKEAPTWGWLQPKFSPKGGVTEQIVKALAQSKKSVRVLAYAFTSEPIITALVDCHKRGVDVEIVLDGRFNGFDEKTSGRQKCVDAGIPVYLDRKHAIAHNKVIIIDEQVVMTGSFNFSQSAELHNAENSVPIQQVDWVKLYLQDYNNHKEHSVKESK